MYVIMMSSSYANSLKWAFSQLILWNTMVTDLFHREIVCM